MDQRVWFRAAYRRAARPAHPSRPYPANERRQLQAQSEQAPITTSQFGYVGSSYPNLMTQPAGISHMARRGSAVVIYLRPRVRTAGSSQTMPRHNDVTNVWSSTGAFALGGIGWL